MLQTYETAYHVIFNYQIIIRSANERQQYIYNNTKTTCNDTVTEKSPGRRTLIPFVWRFFSLNWDARFVLKVITVKKKKILQPLRFARVQSSTTCTSQQ